MNALNDLSVENPIGCSCWLGVQGLYQAHCRVYIRVYTKQCLDVPCPQSSQQQYPFPNNNRLQVRAFEDDAIVHTEGEVNPVNDLKTINDELRFKDIDRLSKVLEERLKSKALQQDKTKKIENEILQAALEHLKSGKWISEGKIGGGGFSFFKDFFVNLIV